MACAIAPDAANPLVVPAGTERVTADVLFTWKSTGGAQYGVDALSVDDQTCDPGTTTDTTSSGDTTP